MTSDVDVDGLVPNFVKEFTFDKDPLLQFQHTFNFDHLSGNRRGIFVIDFRSGAQASRVLVRKGWLTLEGRIGAAGHAFT